MWKALINLVNKWAYRCNHTWELENEEKVYADSDTTKLPIRINRTYVCTKCIKSKKLK